MTWGLQFKPIDQRPSLSNHVERLKVPPTLIRVQELDDKLLGHVLAASRRIGNGGR